MCRTNFSGSKLLLYSIYITRTARRVTVLRLTVELLDSWEIGCTINRQTPRYVRSDMGSPGGLSEGYSVRVAAASLLSYLRNLDLRNLESDGKAVCRDP